ncbi:hypothetical protein C2E23DRAFT_884865 [Lenzites betulinus]|nr:hypothetical protein C2E23DRAFT_884865 [Lenzites betulinus]
MPPFPIGTDVFYLCGGKAHVGTVVDHETIEGLRFVIIACPDNGKRLVKLPLTSVNKVTKPL